jgi:hypothetical protein
MQPSAATARREGVSLPGEADDIQAALSYATWRAGEAGAVALLLASTYALRA